MKKPRISASWTPAVGDPNALLIALFVVIFTNSANADSPSHPPKTAPKTVSAPRLLPVDQRRNSIRGCPFSREADCRRHYETQLREFEVATFRPSRGAKPWVEKRNYAHDPVNILSPRSRSPKPTSLRPDLPWLKKLRLPDLPVHWDKRTIRYLEFYKTNPRGRNIMHAWLRDQGKYKDMILAHLRAAGLPDALLYIAMIESSYDPRETSRSGAGGLWQFMPASARIYGLTIDHWLDERSDPEKSTAAAMLYFSDLYHRFRNWDLALAAYNAGYGGVLRSIAKYNTNDFWLLLEHESALPWESSIYVPKAIASAIVGNNRKTFGFDTIRSAAPIHWDTVQVPRSLSLQTVARAVGSSTTAIAKLNPQLRRSRTPPGIKNYRLYIPRGLSKKFYSKIASLPADSDRYGEYTVPHGQRFEDIAAIHGISRYALARLNQVAHESQVSGGMVLIVPRVSKSDKLRNRKKADQSLYTAGIPKGKASEKLLVPVANKKLRLKGKRRVFYRVVTGDSLYGVARALGVSVRALAKWNDLHPQSHIHARMVLQAFVTTKRDLSDVALLDSRRILVVTRGSNEHLNLAETRKGRKRLQYRARRDESLSSIGRKYGLSSRDLARINRIPHKTILKKGESVIVYKVVDTSRSTRALEQAKKLAKTRRKAKRKK